MVKNWSNNSCRQIINVIAAFAVVIFNNLGEPLFRQSVGAVSDRHLQLITPAGYAFAIWDVIYCGILAFAVYQALPRQRRNARLVRIGYWFALSCAANICWEVIWLNQLIVWSIVPMLAILLTLLMAYLNANINRTEIAPTERWCVNIPFGIYLGWISVATLINGAVFLTALNWHGFGWGASAWTIILLLVATGLALFIGITRVDMAYLVTTIWAFIGVLVANIGRSDIVITTAVLIVINCAALVFVILRRQQLRKVDLFDTRQRSSLLAS